MKLLDIKTVFAFNSFALGKLPVEMLRAFSINPAVPITTSRDRVHQRTVSISNVPQLLQGKGESLKAMQNAEKTQNAKVLLRQDQSMIQDYFGTLDDMSGQRAKSAVLSVLLKSQTELVMMQPQNIPMFLGLYFQRTAVTPKELSSVVTGLHLSHFAKFGVQISKHYQIVACVENLLRVLRVFTGGDGDHFVARMFEDMLMKLQSSEEDALKSMDPVLVLDAVSVALTKWSAVLANPRAVGASEEDLGEALANALVIDVEEVGRSDARLFKRKMEERNFRVDKVARGNTGGRVPAGAGAVGKVPVPGKINYCVAEVAYKLLGGKVFDGRAVLTTCPGKPGSLTPFCVFEHKLPSVPVSNSIQCI